MARFQRLMKFKFISIIRPGRARSLSLVDAFFEAARRAHGIINYPLWAPRCKKAGNIAPTMNLNAAGGECVTELFCCCNNEIKATRSILPALCALDISAVRPAQWN
jgi:hypothetical protein